jgi:hypothetical protein
MFLSKQWQGSGEGRRAVSNYVVSLALAVAAGKDGIPPSRIARGRISLN